MQNWDYNTTELKLTARSLQRVDDRASRVINCVQGIIWITQEGDLEDHVLMPGEQFEATKPGLVVVEALRDARLRITRSTPEYAAA